MVVTRHPKKPLGDLHRISVAAAQGEYVVQWDDDDFYHPDRLTSQLAEIRRSGRPACVLGRWIITRMARRWSRRCVIGKDPLCAERRICRSILSAPRRGHAGDRATGSCGQDRGARPARSLCLRVSRREYLAQPALAGGLSGPARGRQRPRIPYSSRFAALRAAIPIACQHRSQCGG